MTRIIGQIYETLEYGEALNLPRLRQQKSLLFGKLDALTYLDDELLEMVVKGKLDNEIANRSTDRHTE